MADPNIPPPQPQPFDPRSLAVSAERGSNIGAPSIFGDLLNGAGAIAATAIDPSGRGVVNAALTAAIAPPPTFNGAAGAAGGLGGPTGSSLNPQDLLGAMANQNMQMLVLQNQVQTTSNQFTAFSNVLKAKHETERSSIQNLK